MSDKLKTVIVTAGPTNERIDAVMQITNMSTGALGARIVETMLNADGSHAGTAERIGKVYYLSNKLSRKPVVPDGQAYKVDQVTITDAQNLLETMTGLLRREHIDLVVHSCAVGDYKARYSAKAEDLADEIAHSIDYTLDADTNYNTILKVLENPACQADDETKMSSYEKNLMTVMDLTPKVIGCVKAESPSTMLVGFKLLENVSEQELFEVAARLREKNKADYIVANDLALIGNGRHPAMIVGWDGIAERNAIVERCEDKAGIADAICRLAFPGAETKYVQAPAGKRTVWQVIAANNMDTNVRVEGFSHDKGTAWQLMADKFVETMGEMLPGVEVNKAAIYGNQAWTFDDDYRRAVIGADSASVYDGEDMWYYNIVPVSEMPVAPAIPWRIDGPNAPDAAYPDIDEAWINMWLAFKKTLISATGWLDDVPDSQSIMDAKSWGIVKDGIRASCGPMSAEIYDGTDRKRWSLEPVIMDHLGNRYSSEEALKASYGVV